MNEEIQRQFERRQQADYEAIIEVDGPAVARLLGQAIDFVDACRRRTT